MRQILFVDNDPDFLETRSEFLERAGYKAVKATSVAEAERYLREIWTPVAILDIRLEEDDDEKDLSGVTLAKSDLCRSITKVILTNYPSPLLNALLEMEKGDRRQRMVAVLNKEGGYEILLQTLEKAFKEYVHINFSLTLDWHATNPFTLVSHFEPGVENERERLLNRAEELEDLFRRLFYDWERLRVDRVLWQREGRVALTVFAFKGAAMDSFVVVCGQNAKVLDETRHYEESVSKVAGQIGIELKLKAETTHFAANAYHLANADLENVRSLAELYRADPDRLFHTALSTLFERTLVAWDSTQPVLVNKTLDTLYREQLGLAEANVLKGVLEERVQTLLRQIPTLNTNANIKREAGMLIIRLKDQVYRHPDPISILDQTLDFGQPPMVVATPGTFAGDSILVDKKEQTMPATDGAVPEQQKTIRIVRTWLTDFAEAGQAPPPWNYVALEAAIRFDWVEENNLQQLYIMETRLVDPQRFHKLDTQDVDAPARRALRAIDTIRGLAFKKFGKDVLPYQLGVFFQAMSRIVNFNPAFPPTPNEQARLVHALLAMVLIAARLDKPNVLPSRIEDTTLRLDKTNHRFELGAKRANLTPQEFKLACYLFDNSGKTCTYQEILKEVFGNKYGEEYLQTMIDRIRGKIEPDERSPRYILNVRSVGYRLVLNPEK
jgi:DNA-binding response OmpR family regulator